MPPQRVDVAILGGGCAGLSVAVELLARSERQSVAVIEARTHYQNDRTWCFFDTGGHRWRDAAQAAWRSAELRDPKGRQVLRFDDHPYCCLSAQRFYDSALATIRQAGNAHLISGAAVTELARRDNSWRIHAGDIVLEADFVVDARNRADWPAGTLLQHFVGWEIETAEDCFDSATPTLMDFDCPQSAGVEFFYVLPFGPRRALVEATILGERTLALADYRRRLSGYLAQRFGLDERHYSILRQEKGVIPMSPDIEPGSLGPNYIQIGVAGGAARPSTGYAFGAIQRQAVSIAEHLTAGHALPARAALRPAYLTWMDRVFIGVLRERPGRGRELFARLLRAAPGDRLARFMSDIPRPRDLLTVVLAMPIGPFLRKAIGA